MARTPRLKRLELVVLVAIGGFVGANLRYLLAVLLPDLAGTLLANTLGSFLLGALLYGGLYSGGLARRTRSVLSTGVLASFTTYSTFVVEAVQSEPLLAIGYVLATYALGFSGVLLGRAIARGYGREPTTVGLEGGA